MTWIIHQILFHQNVEIENSPNFNNVKVSQYTILSNFYAFYCVCTYAISIKFHLQSMMTPRREAKSPNSTLTVGSTPRRTQSMDRDYCLRNRTSSYQGRLSPTSPRILEEKYVKHNQHV